MSALGSLVVKLALNHAEYTQGLDRTSQDALKFAKSTQSTFDSAEQGAKEFMGNVAAGAAGVVASLFGIEAAISKVKQSIDTLASLDDAAQKTGSSVEDLSRIQKTAKNFGDDFGIIESSITKLAKGLATFDDGANDTMRALDAIGVSAKDNNGELRTSAEIYIDVAKSLQNYKDGAEKTAVANALFGKTGAELLPVMNNLAKGIDDVTGASADSAAQADEFNDALAKSNAAVDSIFSRLAVDLLPTLLNISNAVNVSSQSLGGFGSVSSVVGSILKGLVIAGRATVDVFADVGREIGGRAAQLVALANLDFKGAANIGGELTRDFIRSRADFSQFVDTVLNGDKQISAQVEDGGIKKTIDFSLNMPKAQDAATASIKKTIAASQQFMERLQQEAAQVGKTTLEIRKMEAAKLGLSKQADPLIDKIDQETRAEKELQEQLARVKSITDSVATEQEIYNAKLAELETLKPHLGLETYERALKRLKGKTTGTVAVTRTTTDEISQLLVQAGRNIQSILSNSIFDFFSDGLDGMWRNAKSAIGRILSEFAALKLAQGVGLSSMFAIPGSAMASGGTGGTGIGASSFDIASLGVNAASFLKSGFGATSLIGSAVSQLGSFTGSSSMAAFGGGLAGDAIGGLAAGGFSSGAASAASMGASVAAFAGPAVAVAAVDQIIRMLAGDKMLGGTAGKVLNYVPVIGPLINGLFGRGPLKQKETTLSGTLGAEGFESGSLNTSFVAKGGLFRSDKNDFARVDAVTGAVSTDNDKLQSFADQLAKSSKNIIGLINDTTTQVSTSLRMVGRDLGLSVDSIDSFSRSIELVSEKGKLLTDEQIANEISAITDELARGLIPEVDSLSKRGESAIQTVNRLGIEFNAIVDSAVVILDRTIAESKKLVQSISFEDRTEFVDAAGGVDALSQKVSFFAQNFLTEAERLAPAQEKVTEELGRLGLSSTLTRDQFRDLVQSYGQVNGITGETLQALLNLAPAFVSVTQAAEDATEAAKQQASVALNDAFSVLQKSVDAERQKITDNYNDALKAVNERIQSVSDSIGKLKTLSDALKSTVDALRPMSRQQAKDQIQQAIDAARSGKALPDAKDLQQALGVLGNKSTSGFASSFEFAREQAKTANLIGELGGLTDSQLTVEERSLDALEAQRDRLDQGFRDEIERLDTLLEQGKAQIDSINGLNTSVVSLIDALGQLNLRLLQGGGSGVIDPTTGGAPVGGTNEERGQLINQFINAPGRTPEEIYAASVKYGVTAEELDSQSKFSLKEINDWIDSKGLKRLTGVPGFASGGMHRGGLRIVGERGPELESTGPSRITSNSDLKSIVNNDGVVKAISELQAEISEVKTSNNKVRKILDAVTQGGSYLRVKNIL